jgi:hypothetical protein
MKQLIAFCGPAGVGKTTASNYLVSQGYIRMSFAAPLRDMLRVLGVSDYYLNEAKEIPCPALMGRTVRHALQTIGTDWGRNMISPDIWCRTAANQIHAALLKNNKVVIDDLRFNNEAQEIRALRGSVIRLDRPGFETRMTHESEAGISSLLVDRVFSAPTPADLREMLDQLRA